MARGLHDYKVLQGATVNVLGALVNQSFLDGYLPIGGPFIHQGMFLQGVIKLAQEEIEEEEHLGEYMHEVGV